MNSGVIAGIVSQAEAYFKKATEGDGRGRTGGYLCVIDDRGQIVLVCIIGKVAEAHKAEQYRTFCQEKAIRLATNPTHVSSWQTRDEANKKYGGAVKAQDGFIYSFSGLSELWDEWMSVVIAQGVAYLDMPPVRIQEITAISKNPNF